MNDVEDKLSHLLNKVCSRPHECSASLPVIAGSSCFGSPTRTRRSQANLRSTRLPTFISPKQKWKPGYRKKSCRLGHLTAFIQQHKRKLHSIKAVQCWRRTCRLLHEINNAKSSQLRNSTPLQLKHGSAVSCFPRGAPSQCLSAKNIVAAELKAINFIFNQPSRAADFRSFDLARAFLSNPEAPTTISQWE